MLEREAAWYLLRVAVLGLSVPIIKPLALWIPPDFILCKRDCDAFNLLCGLSLRAPEAFTPPPVTGLFLNGVFIPTVIEMSEIS